MDTPGRPLTFIDVFAGAGGLSLGLMRAGWQGLFAIERDKYAFETLKYNLIDGNFGLKYMWPEWLPEGPVEVGEFLKTYKHQVEGLRGSVDLLAGGPPCQGFSPAGRRKRSDPRNMLFNYYVELASLLRPRFLFFENVAWFDIEFGKLKRRKTNPRRVGRPPKPFSQLVIEALAKLGYQCHGFHEKAVDFGVPQARPRYVLFGVDTNLGVRLTENQLRLGLATARDLLLAELGLPLDRPVTVREAISDLETDSKARTECEDFSGFEQIVYGGPLTPYQRAMRAGMETADPPNSLRLVKHREPTIRRFQDILESCRKGVALNDADRERLGIKKVAFTPLHGDKPSHTLTSLPDDFLHYSEPRILTVREYARLQSFPDKYAFKGKYTSGSDQRRHEVPRYTQVANAVPPLLAEVAGGLLADLATHVIDHGPSNTPSGVEEPGARGHLDLGGTPASAGATTPPLAGIGEPSHLDESRAG